VDILQIVGEDPKQSGDLTFAELHDLVIRSTGTIHDRCLRRHLKGLNLSKNIRGYYETADAVAIVGWIKRRHKYRGYKEFLSREGRALYEKALQICALAA